MKVGSPNLLRSALLDCEFFGNKFPKVQSVKVFGEKGFCVYFYNGLIYGKGEFNLSINSDINISPSPFKIYGKYLEDMRFLGEDFENETFNLKIKCEPPFYKPKCLRFYEEKAQIEDSPIDEEDRIFIDDKVIRRDSDLIDFLLSRRVEKITLYKNKEYYYLGFAVGKLGYFLEI